MLPSSRLTPNRIIPPTSVSRLPAQAAEFGEAAWRGKQSPGVGLMFDDRELRGSEIGTAHSAIPRKDRPRKRHGPYCHGTVQALLSLLSCRHRSRPYS